MTGAELARRDDVAAGDVARSLDDVEAMLAEGGAGRCDRCRRAAGTHRLDARARPAKSPTNGTAPASAKVLATVCEPCAAAILTVVGRAVGLIRGGT